ncbi:hypothetical protein [Lactococcus garvieae]|uniref:hypothetical protein n=1 Tax=Lactococcus garvieae TaxID=1363 RepID=UPI00398E54C0
MNNNIQKGYDEYKKFLNAFFPKFKINDEVLFPFYCHINNAFVLYDVMLEHEKVDRTSNYHSILLESREFYARLLTIVAINDKYLIDNILRLIVEKIYRILFGITKPLKQESTIRKISREKMKSEISKVSGEDEVIDELNKLYNDYSVKIHHTVSVPSDYYNLTKRLVMDSDEFLQDVVEDMSKLETIFINKIFNFLVIDSEKEDTSFKMRIRNNTTDDIIKQVGL